MWFLTKPFSAEYISKILGVLEEESMSVADIKLVVQDFIEVSLVVSLLCWSYLTAPFDVAHQWKNRRIKDCLRVCERFWHLENRSQWLSWDDQASFWAGCHRPGRRNNISDHENPGPPSTNRGTAGLCMPSSQAIYMLTLDFSQHFRLIVVYPSSTLLLRMMLHLYYSLSFLSLVLLQRQVYLFIFISISLTIS